MSEEEANVPQAQRGETKFQKAQRLSAEMPVTPSTTSPIKPESETAPTTDGIRLAEQLADMVRKNGVADARRILGEAISQPKSESPKVQQTPTSSLDSSK